MKCVFCAGRPAMVTAALAVFLAATAGAQSLPAAPGSQVLFSRSAQSEGQKPAQNAGQPVAKAGTAQVPEASDAERQALTITAYDLNLHLVPREHSLAVEARLTVKNAGAQPLDEMALQISSALQFEGIESEGAALPYQVRTVQSGADHTGALNEADIRLKQPLAPGATMPVTVLYSGEITQTGKRLEALGAPQQIAEASDWDRVAEGFVGLRGFGNVVWYPVSSVPAPLGQGNQLFEEIGRQKMRESDATVAMQVTLEYANHAPDVAMVDGQVVKLGPPVSTPQGAFPGVLEFSVPARRLGFEAPSIFVAERTVSEKGAVAVYARPEDAAKAEAYLTAAGQVSPVLEKWLGPKARTTLAVLDLPEGDDAPAEVGGVLLTPLLAAQPEALDLGMMHALTHAYFHSRRPWLEEGVASFMVSLWIEQTKGREAALEHLEATRGALAIAEPASPGAGGGEPLMEASDPVHVRTKAAYVFWMLRSLAGDAALAKALTSYDAAKDTTPDYFEKLLEQASGKDLGWFFKDWVYEDPGLPDLEITHVYPSAENLGLTLVAIDVTNHGYAAVEVPMTLISTKTKVTRMVRVPAHGMVTERVEIAGQPVSVQVNDGTVPEVSASLHIKTLQP
ncbi:MULTISPECIES: M1 family metallopeptidase [Acidobacterium]|nr:MULTISPECIES: M1 family metallopeptidase [Acidobacterium]HCT59903.1 hypothetical protein [Acidobacterium sp.]